MKRITIHRETLRRLDESQLHAAQGGMPRTTTNIIMDTEWTAYKCWLTGGCLNLTDGCPCWG